MISQTQEKCVFFIRFSTPQKGAEGSPMIHDFILSTCQTYLGISGGETRGFGLWVSESPCICHCTTQRPHQGKGKERLIDQLLILTNNQNQRALIIVNVENVGKRIRGQWNQCSPKLQLTAAPQWTNSWGNLRTFVPLYLARFATARLGEETEAHATHVTHATAISRISVCHMCHMCHMCHIPRHIPRSTRPSPPFPLPGQLASSKSLTFAPSDFTCRWPCSIMRSASSRHVTVCTWQFWHAEYKPTDILHMQGEGRRDEKRWGETNEET